VPTACSAAELRIIAATLLILLAFMFSFVLAVGAAFIGAPTIATDIESGVLLAVLPRPIRRSDVVLGKWLGLATLITAYAGLACGMEFVIAKISFGYVPSHPIIAILFLVAEALVVLALTLAASTKMPAMTCGIVVVVLFGLTWMSGIAGAVGAAPSSLSKKLQCRFCIETFDRKFNKDRHESRKHPAELEATASAATSANVPTTNQAETSPAPTAAVTSSFIPFHTASVQDDRSKPSRKRAADGPLSGEYATEAASWR